MISPSRSKFTISFSLPDKVIFTTVYGIVPRLGPIQLKQEISTHT